MVESVTRPALGLAEVTELLYSGLGETPAVVDHREFTDGYFNAVHAVTLEDGRRLVVKVAPRADLRLLRYETDLMATEADFIARAAAAGVSLPRLWHADPAAGVMIMDRCTGRLLHEARSDMEPSALMRMRTDVGKLCAAVTSVTGEAFGYPFRDGRTRSARWSESFLSIIDDILADAADFDRDLTRPADDIRALLGSYTPLLDAVTVPALVHFDLWDGNIFVRESGGEWQIEGVIDGERSLWGDPLMELVSQISFLPEDESAAVVHGFLGRELTADEERRLCMYRCYLLMILAVEGATRHYPEDLDPAGWARERLAKDLTVLDG